MLSATIRTLAAALALCVLCPLAAAQTVLYPDLEGRPLLDAIRADYSPTGTLGYGPARDVLYGWEQNRNGNLRAVYTGFTVVLSGDPSSSAFEQGVNTEHTWPQGLGMRDEPQRSDMHNLFPTRIEVNGARANFPFGEIPDAETDTWFRLTQQQSSIPGADIDEWSEVDGSNPVPGFFGRFEPREDHGGNVARAMFYVYTIWETELDTSFLRPQLGDLLDWHVQDEVDVFEADRNAFIASEQGNLNPFILDSTLARRAFFEDDNGGGPPTGSSDDLLISEYVEGSGLNKAVEIYNGTDEAVSLSGYSLQIFFNGSPSPGTTINLTGSIAPGDVFVLAEGNADPAILAVADQTTTMSLYNGDDAVVLYQGTEAVDAIGQIGFDPGDEWGSGNTSTRDNTLRRIADNCTASDPTQPFDPAERYVGFPNGTFDGLGSAALNCQTEPVVTADIEPVDAPVVIPASGGFVHYTVTLTNTTDEAQTVTVETNALLPSGNAFGPVEGPVTVEIPAGGTLGPRMFAEKVFAKAPAGTYTGFVMVMAGGEEIASDSFEFEKLAARDAAVRADEASALATIFPNPVRDAATVRFAVPEAGTVRLVVYDVLGREVVVLADGMLDAGEHDVRFEGADLPSGVYLIRFETGVSVQTQRVTVVR